MQVWQPIEGEASLIFLPAPLYFPISPHTPPLLLTPLLATPGVFGTPPPWDSPPLSALDTPFFCPHLQPLLPHLPMCEGYWVAPVPEIPQNWGIVSRPCGPIMTKWFTISWSITNRFTADNIEIKC